MVGHFDTVREEPAATHPVEAAPMEPLPSAPNPPAMVSYLMKLFAVVAVLYLVPLALVRTQFYRHRSLSYYSRPLNYAFETPVKDADVLLFGDSTVLLGIDPGQLSSSLGVPVLNLPNTRGSLMVNDDLPLRRYLAKNRPPKLIVFYFAPWDFDYGNTPFEAFPVFEGEEVLAAQGSFRQILAFAQKQPADVALFPLRFYADFWEFLSHKVSHRGQDETLAATHGHIENTDPSVLASPCTFPPLLLDSIRFDWVKRLGARYATVQTKVLFFVAPVPQCSNVAELLKFRYSELPAAPPVQQSPETFVRDIRYIHPHPDAVPKLTQNLLEAIRPVLSSSRSR